MQGSGSQSTARLSLLIRLMYMLAPVVSNADVMNATTHTYQTVCPLSADLQTLQRCSAGANAATCPCGTMCATCYCQQRCVSTGKISPCDFSGLVVMGLAILFSSAAGIGGGGLNVPIFLSSLWHFQEPQAMVLSHVTIFGNACGSVLANFIQVDGWASLDLQLCLVLIPPFIAGHAIGIEVFPIFPPFVPVFVLGLLLIMATIKSLRKGLEMWRARSNSRDRETSLAALAQGSASVAVADSALASDPAPARAAARGSVAVAGVGLHDAVPYMAINDDNSAIGNETDGQSRDGNTSGTAWLLSTPGMAVPILLLVWTMWVFQYFALGSSKHASFIAAVDTCNATYWLVFAVPLIVTFCFVLALGFGSTDGRLSFGICQRRAAENALLQGSAETECASATALDFTTSQITFVAVASAGIGTVAGLCGIGGGEFLTPFLLKLGLAPVPASAVSAFAILLAVSSDVVHYIALGKLAPLREYCIVLCCMAFTVAFAGRMKIIKWVRQHDMGGAIVLALAAVLLACAGLALFDAFKRTSEFTFDASNVCKVHQSADTIRTEC